MEVGDLVRFKRTLKYFPTYIGIVVQQRGGPPQRGGLEAQVHWCNSLQGDSRRWVSSLNLEIITKRKNHGS